MNYRHAFHAGNFADCFKHALLVALIEALRQKPAPFSVLDTHAGLGQYDLEDAAARRTGEARQGILRLMDAPATGPLAGYLSLVRRLGLYPGSPRLAEALLRPQDRLVCCDTLPEAVHALRHLFRADPRVSVHHRSGWEALGSLLPPREKRGLVLIDPPYEAADEFATVAEGLARGHRRFGHGIFAAWYPIKHLASVRGFLDIVRDLSIRDIMAVHLYLRDPTDPGRMNGCGLLVINPPYRFPAQAGLIADAVLRALGTAEPGARTDLIRLADE
ncbi:23S rRNA (adenine(2030)-N(6))-methyltransferase RlmJ [Rhodopila sp.]|jgi:23S rRNA (adenine2030-N6)-methyltransferase|uniref:23S rRNA (adenine(2030)-N(6))-methyltransferase RlmJ n=1 Tax=Rhodopila sp. TaxID=2480087 RepID=UPI002CFA6CBB|nr:23S rRNA (adenine(2030)-N(6))-methyltransferase RlmJ [Rhodopila sp.]HVZ09405.1 23S rRNA (adenine(2030)-N(6))-methyltransferase RlmJ [Rhodopila sp.]